MSFLHRRTFRRWTRRAAAALFLAGCLALVVVGCSKHSDNAEGGGKLKVGYLGLTCEGPIYAAYENGYFKDEGLDVELAKTDWDNLRDGLGTGRFDATQHLTSFLLKATEQGVDLTRRARERNRVEGRVGAEMLGQIDDLEPRTRGRPVAQLFTPHSFRYTER